mmetsp:Transcript_51110/g.163608  ORF Transcript_51110/g.163608 Transcript_51110/m.163608 type:complete len:297 (-) Transcript_51110:531-1421(-)
MRIHPSLSFGMPGKSLSWAASQPSVVSGSFVATGALPPLLAAVRTRAALGWGALSFFFSPSPSLSWDSSASSWSAASASSSSSSPPAASPSSASSSLSSSSTSSPLSSSPSPTSSCGGAAPPAAGPITLTLRAQGVSCCRPSRGSSTSKATRSPTRSPPSGTSVIGICASLPQTSEMSWQKMKCLPVVGDGLLTMPVMRMRATPGRGGLGLGGGLSAPLPACSLLPPLPPPLAPFLRRPFASAASASSLAARLMQRATGAAVSQKGGSTSKEITSPSSMPSGISWSLILASRSYSS